MLLKTKYTHREQNKNIHVSKRVIGNYKIDEDRSPGGAELGPY